MNVPMRISPTEPAAVRPVTVTPMELWVNSAIGEYLLFSHQSHHTCFIQNYGYHDDLVENSFQQYVGFELKVFNSNAVNVMYS